MKNLKNNVSKALLAGILIAGAGVSGSVSAVPSDSAFTVSNAAETMILAVADFGGKNPNENRAANRLHKRVHQTGVVATTTAMGSHKAWAPTGRQSNIRHAHDQQLEKVQFARFEEMPAATSDESKFNYRGVSRVRPAYVRN